MSKAGRSAERGVTLGSVALVWVGGSGGTALRHALGLVGPVGSGILVILVVNVVGSLLLGALTERLGSTAGGGRRRALQLLLGVGFLGGFTTYSALAVDTVLLGSGAEPGGAAAYALGSVVLGVLAAAAGRRLARP